MDSYSLDPIELEPNEREDYIKLHTDPDTKLTSRISAAVDAASSLCELEAAEKVIGSHG